DLGRACPPVPGPFSPTAGSGGGAARAPALAGVGPRKGGAGPPPPLTGQFRTILMRLPCRDEGDTPLLRRRWWDQFHPIKGGLVLAAICDHDAAFGHRIGNGLEIWRG